MKKLLLLMALVLSFALSSYAETLTLTVDYLGMSTNSYKDYTKVDEKSGLTFKVHAAVNNGIALNNNKGAFIAVLDNKNNVTITNITFTMGTQGTKYVYKVIKSDKAFTLPKDNTSSGVATLTGEEVAEISKTNNSDGGTFEVSAPYVGLYQVSGNMCSFTSIVITYEEGGPQKADAELSFADTEFSVELGEEFTAPALENPNNLAVTYTSSDEAVATVDAEGNVTVKAVGTTVITASSEATDEFKAGEASYIIRVNEPLPEGALMEELTASAFNIKKADGYSDYSYTSELSGISYKANVANTDENCIQFRTSDSKAGLVVIANPKSLILKEVRVEWLSGTSMKGTQVDIYGNEQAYTAAADLYATTGNTNQGKKIASAISESKTEATVNPEGDYSFIGLRSNDGAMQLSKIVLVWIAAEQPVAPAKPTIVNHDSENHKVTLSHDDVECTFEYRWEDNNANQPQAVALANEEPVWTPIEGNELDYNEHLVNTNPKNMLFYVRAVKNGVAGDAATFEVSNPGGTTGIADIEADMNAPVEYYNLQGVRVAEPAAGMYLRRQGGKVSKVVIR